jgi:hypothetical protein
LGELASRQHGVVSIRQLIALGYSRSAIERGREVGRLHQLDRGVYAVVHTNLTPHGHCLAGVLACGPRALLSHYSASWLWGLTRHSPIPVHATGPSPRGGRPPVRIHRARNLIEEDRSLQDGIPVTSPARTALDMAPRLKPGALRKLLQRAEELQLLDLDAFEAVADRSRGHRGGRPLRLALALYRPPPFSRSDFETRFLDLIAAAGLPRPSTGFNVLGYELDFYWPAAGFVIELDVYETHGSRNSFHSDRRRDEDLTLAGLEVIRVTDKRLEDSPAELIERLRKRLPSTPAPNLHEPQSSRS